ncbi:hypothetical protein ALC53_11378 [Atta colombica]|uniref:Uncharacterized protein n=1 Tax=Atta colombica TaxID=520822 RepID=A0A195B126_9HYME|nr:hypothetical protein ALC53_11378 [Atta colombica]
MANRMRMLSVADSCEPVAERPYEITRPYLRHGKNRRGTFYSVSSVKKISSLLRSLCASKRVDSTRAIRFHSVPHSPLISYSIAKRDYLPASTLSYSSSMTANPTSESNDGRKDVSKSRSSLGVISSQGLLGEHKKPRCIRSRLLYARSRKIQRYAIRGLCFVPLSRL